LLHVSDDGRGGITAPGNGLAGISERVKSLGGTLHIESPRGKGSVLCVRLPFGLAPSIPRSEAVAVARAEVGRSEAGRTEVGRTEQLGETTLVTTSNVVHT
jgi:hypothetical protein